MRIAIIGAGLAGLTAARTLSQAGLSPVVHDKGRGLGGRMSTRRAEGGLQFDHGAQYLSASTPEFAAFLREAEQAGAAKLWTIDDGSQNTVGTPGMSAIAKYLATGIDIRQSVEVPSIGRETGGWSVAGAVYDRVICTVPAPQAVRLIEPSHPFVNALHAVAMEPNLTLMLALPAGTRHRFITRREPEDDIAWLALDSSKHVRAGPDCWVAQAGQAWSRSNLERDKDDIAAKMLPLVCDRLGVDPADAVHVSAHRWRYAHTSKPLGQPYLTDADTMFLGGDWALSARAEGAWRSGMAMAEAVMKTR